MCGWSWGKEKVRSWTKRDYEKLAIYIDDLDYELVRSIRPANGRGVVSAIVRKKVYIPRGKYPRGLGAVGSSVILTFGPKALEDLAAAVILEFHHWGILPKRLAVVGNDGQGNKRRTANGY